MAATIRPAEPDDAARLAELRYEFRAGRAPAQESRGEFVVRCTEWMRLRLAGGAWRCWVAEREGEIVGHIWLHVIEKIPNPVAEAEWHGYITNMYVQEEHRGGVGSALLDAALLWCKRAGPRLHRAVADDTQPHVVRQDGFRGRQGDHGPLVQNRLSPGLKGWLSQR